MTPDAQALAPVLAKLNFDEVTSAWLPDAITALQWVADNLHAEGEAGDALRERLGLLREGGGMSLQTKDSGSWTHRRLVSLWEPQPLADQEKERTKPWNGAHRDWCDANSCRCTRCPCSCDGEWDELP